MGEASIIEQRWSQRRPLSLGVEIFESGVLIASCHSRDVGLGGVFLNVNDHVLESGQSVELHFSLDGLRDGSCDAKPLTKHHLKAKVVRVLDQGVGLVFKHFDTSSLRVLQEIMRHSTAEV